MFPTIFKRLSRLGWYKKKFCFVFPSLDCKFTEAVNGFCRVANRLLKDNEGLLVVQFLLL